MWDKTSMEENNNSTENRGMSVYERIVDQAESRGAGLNELIEELKQVDTTGQFLASTARYLSAVDREYFEPWLTPLIEAAIERDRERRYIGSLLEAIWGADYEQRVEELRASDNNFRRIYRRMHPELEAM